MKPECRRAKKAAWKRHKMKTDAEFRDSQKLSNKKWAQNNPGYWMRYREKNKDKTQRNRMLQSIRNRRRAKQRTDGTMDYPRPIAKVDASISKKIETVGRFWLVPVIAKVDALKVNIFEISGCYDLLQRATR
jgi:hypothetical protein